MVNNLTNKCDFEGLKPAILDIPYPEMKVSEKNLHYAALLTEDYCSGVSELTAITQYVNHETRISGYDCNVARVILSIAMAEMTHLQILGQVIILLGGNLTYNAVYKEGAVPWEVSNVVYGYTPEDMLLSDIRGEKGAINQYIEHINMIDDPCVKSILKRIVMDEQYHVALLSDLLVNLC
ncbi:MAG: ferritin-like domain-containing protein [Clostridium sp.]